MLLEIYQAHVYDYALEQAAPFTKFGNFIAEDGRLLVENESYYELSQWESKKANHGDCIRECLRDSRGWQHVHDAQGTL